MAHDSFPGREGLPASRLVGSATALNSGATTYSDEFSTVGHRGLIVVLNISAKTGTIGITATVQGYDDASAAWYDLLASASKTATGTTVLEVHPAITVVANAAASAQVPSRCRVKLVDSGTAGGSNHATYTVGATFTP